MIKPLFTLCAKALSFTLIALPCLAQTEPQFPPLNQPVALSDSDYVAPAEEIAWAKQFRGVSGAGHSVTGDGRGGWISGSNGIRYSGEYTRPEYTPITFPTTDLAMDKGLFPPITPALDVHLRDGVVTLGGDGMYYLTGSSGDNIWAWAQGIELWRSADLHQWNYLGLVWEIDTEAPDWVKRWRKHPRRATRAVWAPEIHYVKGNYYIVYSMCPGAIGIIKSSTGRPDGPYVNAFSYEGPIADGIDGTLFEDTDGSVYFTYAGGDYVARLKDDMSGFATPFRKITIEDYDLDPAHHARNCPKRAGCKDLAHEGATLFKHDGKYYIGGADSYEHRYSPCIAVSDSLYGPYRMRHEAVPCGGGTGFFQDRDGNWWCSVFGNDAQAHFREKVGFVKVRFCPSGRVIPDRDQPFVPKSLRKEWRKKWDKVWKSFTRKTETSDKQ